MKNITISSYEDQERRLKIKNINQQMINLAIEGIGISPWEAKVLVNVIEEVYFSDGNFKELKHGQMKYNCISAKEGPGKPLKKCQMVNVSLTLHDENDYGNFSSENNKDRSIELRKRKLVRIAEEAKEQGGYLTQEDLAKLLMCDVRTIRRDTNDLRKQGIILPTRGQQKDIGPGVSHRAIAIRLWLEGKEPVAIAQHIKHSIKAVENYLQKFKRVAFLRGKHFDDFQIAMTVGISVAAAQTFSQIYNEFKSAPFFRQRLKEIDLVGAQYWHAVDEKKRLEPPRNYTTNEWRKQ